jgi:hypothetical protein
VLWRFVLIVVAVALVAVPIPACIVERYYSAALFPLVQSMTTSASNQTAVAWFDLLLIAVVGVQAALAVRDWTRRGAVRGLARILLRLATTAAVLLILFMTMWGWNYQRESLRRKLPFDQRRVSVDAALQLARETVTQANGMHAAAHAHGWADPGVVDPSLAEAFRAALRELHLDPRIVPGRPKRTVLDLYFRRAGVAAMTDPFFLETLVSTDILPFERPHVVAHEWAHLAGITDEGEANFVGWLACLRGGTSDQYSGWLFLYTEVVGGLPREAAREVAASLASGPRADLQAMRERSAREVSPRLSSAGWQVYDQYLRANRIEAGTASYAEVVQLVLGTGIR